MARLNGHGTELERMEYPGCRLAIMSDGSLMRNDGLGWRRWRRLKAGVGENRDPLQPGLGSQLVNGGVDAWVRGEDNASDHAPAWIELNV